MSLKQSPRFLQAVVNLPQLPDDRLYDYQIPPQYQELISPGQRILAPFGRQKAEAIVWKVGSSTKQSRIKDIEGLLDQAPLLTAFQLSLIDWMAKRFFCRRQDLLRLFLPPGLNLATEKCWRLLASRRELMNYLTNLPLLENLRSGMINKLQNISTTLQPIPKLAADEERLLLKMISSGLIETEWASKKQRVKQKKVQAYHLSDTNRELSDLRLTPKQTTVLEYISAFSKPVSTQQIMSKTKVSASVLKALVIKGLLKETSLRIERLPFYESPSPDSSEPIPTLNEEQERAFRAISESIMKNKSDLFLLHGITGSGKTEIYLRAIEETIKRGKEAVYLVPEISLTPQTVERTRGRFGEAVAIMHSNLSDGERFDQWWRIKKGKIKVVVGARSALFAPLPNLGLIILDEEHEYSYKQEETPRYHCREVAEEICKRKNCLLIMGSATPSLESYYSAKTDRYSLLKMTHRVYDRPLPEVQLIDLRTEFKAGHFTALSPLLKEGLKETLSRGEQAILLLNRRGYATFIICRECGSVLKCPACDVSLTYHQRPNLLNCHYCDYRKPPPDLCPNCKSHYLRYFGRGTERLEEELTRAFPEARILRMDRDTTRRKGSHEKIYRRLVRGKADILLGTQMVAKGLDLPGVTLVGVIAADGALNLPDFRSAERTYQILTQAAGRAGRGAKPGVVFIQTYNPEHYSVSSVTAEDDDEFYQKELAFRQAGRYPPFVNLIRLIFSGVEQETVSQSAKVVTSTLRDRFRTESEDIEVIGPHAAPIEKIQNYYRWQSLIKARELSSLYTLLPEVINDHPPKRNKKVRIIIDENPFSML